MNAKQAREYAKTLLTKVEGANKTTFDRIISEIESAIGADPTKQYTVVEMPPKQVVAWLESKDYGYETAIVNNHEGESALKISWSEEGIKMYGNDR